jgi:hypothetical protein
MCYSINSDPAKPRRKHRIPSDRWPRKCGRIARIPLNHGHHAILDATDIELVRGFVWYLRISHAGNKYAKANTPDGGHHYLHRLILGITDPGVKVDHRDGDGLNCRRSNLRIASVADNNRNRRSKRGFYKGVHSHRRKWYAIIGYQGKRIYLGLFSTPEAAAIAYNRKATELFGQFAYLNDVATSIGEQKANIAL